MWTTEKNILAFDRYLTWITITADNKDFHKPFKTPAILGGAFVATKRFLEEIDYFGLGMQGWGYENIEISMKVKISTAREQRRKEKPKCHIPFIFLTIIS